MLNFVPVNFLAFKRFHNTVASLTIPIRVHSTGHALVGCRIIKQCTYFTHDEVVIGAHKVHGAALEGFGALGGVAHHLHGLAQAVDGQGFAVTDIVDEKRYQFLRELVGAVVVGAIGDYGGEAEGVVESAD